MRAAAADFANGISSVVKVADWLFVNPELTLTLSLIGANLAKQMGVSGEKKRTDLRRSISS